MHKITHLTAAIGLAIAPVLLAAPARALNHTWVASYGTDNQGCGFRPSPCATFGRAYINTDAGGEITCVDSGNYGGAEIAKSITINCENAIGSNTAPGGGVGFFSVNTAAADIVTLRGLDLDGLGVGNGISFSGAGTLHVHKVKINNAHSGVGISFNPSDSAKLFVSDSTITDNGSSGTASGILIRPSSGVSAQVSITRTLIENNFYGIIADGTAGGTIRGVVRDSVVAGSPNIGITVGAAASSTVILLIDNTNVSGNNYGLVANGTTAGMAVSRSSIMFNNTGLFTVAGGVLGTYQDNRLGGNTANGTFTAAAGLQ